MNSLSHLSVLTLVFQIMGASSKEENLFMNQTLQESDLNKDLWMLPCYNYMHMNL